MYSGSPLLVFVFARIFHKGDIRRIYSGLGSYRPIPSVNYRPTLWCYRFRCKLEFILKSRLRFVQTIKTFVLIRSLHVLQNRTNLFSCFTVLSMPKIKLVFSLCNYRKKHDCKYFIPGYCKKHTPLKIWLHYDVISLHTNDSNLHTVAYLAPKNRAMYKPLPKLRCQGYL